MMMMVMCNKQQQDSKCIIDTRKKSLMHIQTKQHTKNLETNKQFILLSSLICKTYETTNSWSSQQDIIELETVSVQSVRVWTVHDPVQQVHKFAAPLLLDEQNPAGQDTIRYALMISVSSWSGLHPNPKSCLCIIIFRTATVVLWYMCEAFKTRECSSTGDISPNLAKFQLSCDWKPRPW